MEFEPKELKLRTEDAMNSKKAAVEEGIVPGGGVAFPNSIDIVNSLSSTDKYLATGHRATPWVLHFDKLSLMPV
ncbi:unnamed protein product [Gongylonema pulchrum]|uniref:Reverse transcriptase domain-containing protein n=1 Tax=Gongylonema pulchrum TaxID=637853 RepID=A0A183DL56_9BILA|nr:unnamed protein product [Gongylonema pulchrum]